MSDLFEYIDATDLEQQPLALSDQETIALYTIALDKMPLYKMQLHNVVFLSSQKIRELQGLFTFKPSTRGAHSTELHNALKRLDRLGLIEKIATNDTGIVSYTVSHECYMRFLRLDVNREAHDAILRYKRTIRGMNLSEQLLYLNANYPEYLKRSNRLESIIPLKHVIATKMFQKKLLTFIEASKLARSSMIVLSEIIRIKYSTCDDGDNCTRIYSANTTTVYTC